MKIELIYKFNETYSIATSKPKNINVKTFKQLTTILMTAESLNEKKKSLKLKRSSLMKTDGNCRKSGGF